MSTLEVNAIKSRTGTDITIDSTATITGTASQFKITGGTAGQAIITDGSGGLSFGAVDSLPSQTSQSGKFLTTDGSTASWSTITHPNELPTQTSQSGKFLTTDGTDASWDTIDEFSVSIADAPPGSASTGALWWESDTGRLKIYYNDGSSSQWVDAFPVAEPGATDPAMGGDLTGTASNAQIAANKVGITELNVADGTTGQVLTTNGSGTLSFTTISADPTMGGDLTGTASNAQIAAGAVGSTEIATGAVGATEIASTIDLSSKTVTLPAASVTPHSNGVKIVHKTSTFTMTASDFDDCGTLIIDNDTSTGAYTVTMPPKEDWEGKIIICCHGRDTTGSNALTFNKHANDGGTTSMTSVAHPNTNYQILSTGNTLTLMHTDFTSPGGP